MDFKRVAVVGIDCISLSIALGLKAQKEPPEIVGHDADGVAADLALTQGAFDRLERRLDRTCENTDLVIVAVPLHAVRETFVAIAPHLQPGCLVTDTARLKAPVLGWADELLPQSVFFVGGHPMPNPAIVGFDTLQKLETASTDLLREALYCITPSTRVPDILLDAFIGTVKALGAHLYFIDANEHDGLQASAEGLPDLLAVALLRASVDNPGWQEMRKFTGFRFATATEAAGDARACHTAVFLNHQHVLPRLDILLSQLAHLRDLLAQDDTEALEEIVAAAAEGRARWIEERRQGMWIEERAVNTGRLPSISERLKELMFGGIVTRRTREQDRSEE